MFQRKCFYVASGALIAFSFAWCTSASAQTTESPARKILEALHLVKKTVNISNPPESMKEVKEREKEEKRKAASESYRPDTNALYDPTHPDMNKSFSLANKSFEGTVTMQDQQSLLKLPVYNGKQFITSPDSLKFKSADVGNDGNTAFDKSFPATGYSTKGAYQSSAKVEEAKTFAVPAKTLYGKDSFSTKTAPGFDKAYTGPLPVLARTIPKTGSSVLSLSDVSKFPNHPLSVDEVKSLLNHGQPVPDDSQEDDAVPAHPVHGDQKPPFAPDPNNPYESNFQAVDPASRHPEQAEPLPQ